jgi:hypothetical protein
MERIIDEIKSEIEKLDFEDYRRQQGVRLEAKQLKLLKHLFQKIESNCNKLSIDDFCRIVDDYSSLESNISILSERLYLFYNKK